MWEGRREFGAIDGAATPHVGGKGVLHASLAAGHALDDEHYPGFVPEAPPDAHRDLAALRWAARADGDPPRQQTQTQAQAQSPAQPRRRRLMTRAQARLARVAEFRAELGARYRGLGHQLEVTPAMTRAEAKGVREQVAARRALHSSVLDGIAERERARVEELLGEQPALVPRTPLDKVLRSYAEAAARGKTT